MESTCNPKNRRAFSRVGVYIPIDFRLVPDNEREFVRSRICGEPVFVTPQRPSLPKNHPQTELIKLLNNKLDRILQALMLQSECFHSLPFKYVTLSGNGMMFSSQEAYALGDLLEVKMMLSANIPVAIYLYGEVVKIQKQTSGFFIAVSFQSLDETIRSRIVQFVFETERELLWERSKNS